ncbi:hypothetical protein NP493_290g02006 [Ridgeia piscesae]|uniref:CUB domain-containing protein n=1 Tax=Ridgeia piscesae TaxID=27915 RepID=A0AAD9NWW9_RIDPI|nr:hypothetical protein NP493_290g02006 [Ridgeia piscesae]
MLIQSSKDLIVAPLFAGCDHHFVSSGIGQRGNFSSPGYPDPYPAKSYCRYFFTATPDERIKLSFLEFDLLPGNKAGCLFDYVDIFTIDITNMKQLLNRLCDQNLPQPIISVHQRIELVFKSTFADQKHVGFLGTYEFIDERWQPFPQSSPHCGSEFVTGVGGELTSPGFPDPYPANIECTWMIRVGYDQKVLINFMTLDMGQSVHCGTSYVSLYNGFASPTADPVKKLCGQQYFYEPGFKEFKSNTFRIVVRFKADDNEYGSSGFRLSWTAVELPKVIEDEHGNYVDEPCEGFLCKGGEYCIDTEGLLCNPLPRYCIDATLRCNGLPNCGVYDQSDEETCLKEIALIILSVVVPLILIVVVATAVVMWRRKRLEATEAATKTSNSPDMSMKKMNGTNMAPTKDMILNTVLKHASSPAGGERHKMANSYVNPPSTLMPIKSPGNDLGCHPPKSFGKDFERTEQERRDSCESPASQGSVGWVPPAYNTVVNVNQQSFSVTV